MGIADFKRFHLSHAQVHAGHFLNSLLLSLKKPVSIGHNEVVFSTEAVR